MAPCALALDRVGGRGKAWVLGRIQPPFQAPGVGYGPLCPFSQPGLPCCLWVVPSPLSSGASPLQQGLGHPALTGCGIRGHQPPAVPAAPAGRRAAGGCFLLPGGPAHLLEQSLPAGAHPEGDRRPVTWKINRGPESPQAGPQPRQRPPFRQPWEWGQATDSPAHKGIQAGQTGLLSRGLGAQGPPRKGDSLGGPKSSWGPAGQTKAEAFGMRQVPPCPLQLPFRGISHDSLGRATYLCEQHRQEPEKFLYPVLSSWEYSRHVGKGHPSPAMAGLCRQAWPPSWALSSVSPHPPACPSGPPLSEQATYLHTPGLGQVLAVEPKQSPQVPGLCQAHPAGDIVKDAGAPAHARSQPIAKSFYIKSSIFHFPRRTDQLM
ncbi:uncharacterized protein LOC130679583 [Manis pentadactyla]|uniref:uncharacterized protein LOC130679583 n=1 Tax=Manis pentadactyla TaxID=143292 RepID=UPI00255CDD3A|nr:uncharacterized protein LOC130679583 [Manis pentadactyla]